MPPDRSPRIALTVTDEMYEALQVESSKTGAPISAIVRKALDGYLTRLGYKVTSDVTWGGWRRSEQDEDSPELAEVGTD